MSALIGIAKPGMRLGDRPERRLDVSPSLAYFRIINTLRNLKKTSLTEKRFESVLLEIDVAETHYRSLSSVEKQTHRLDIALKLRRSDVLQHHNVIEAFALVRATVHEHCGLQLHPEQLFAGWAMLHGSIAQMQTGEGKTLTALLPAVTMALSGSPVHVITVNEYLAQRDARQLAPIYQALGLRCQSVQADMSAGQKRQAYEADIVYCTNKQVVFDYLRDALQHGHAKGELASACRSLTGTKSNSLSLRGLGFAIIDEADSVLIDDARVPLILAESRPTENNDIAESALALSIASALKNKIDFTLDSERQSVVFSQSGDEKIALLTSQLSGAWEIQRYRHELLRQALNALHTYKLDSDYIVQDGQVVLIDESTGRPMPDRKLQHGLHRMLELKEKCTVTNANDVVAGLSFQCFFQRYCELSGMSGTLTEVRKELSQIYGKKVVCVSTHKKSRRHKLPTLIFANQQQQLEYALTDIKARHDRGQPILIGVRTVSVSEHISQLLSAQNINHAVLNARQDAEEASIVSLAGKVGSVTVATNMAGRGTDIELGDSVAQLGGLHVINLSINDSSRVDRQLVGRAARQGDPGSCQAILHLQDGALLSCVPAKLIQAVVFIDQRLPSLGQYLALGLVRYVQSRMEREATRQRLMAYRAWPQLKKRLSFAGEME